ncbi:MerR family transcriptional regulator [Microbacterium murale]|uniref:DNA polymerase-3 subunit beta n=1 Tax=Microbacterium murale TaxID=1081040 RepID=A0ABU0PEM3_9MICO|nr:MerR family transcriptional regulator [Microbacterium murale]MDQ0645146.1 DNA polymerase-3 subunit beta [Microbacterium murale]
MSQPHESGALRSQAGESSQLQTINAFARAVGLSASALRQYGESGLLAPADVEERTGYRYYSLDQQQRAIWIRRLRDAGLRLDRIRSVFEDGTIAAEAILNEWRADTRERSEAIAALVDDLILTLRAQEERNPARRTSARFDAAVLASAIRQVASASADADGDGDHDGVLIEAGSSSVAIVATDRFVLLSRTALPAAVDGPPVRVRLAPAPVLEWLRFRRTVDLVVDAPAGRDHDSASAAVRFRDEHDDELPLPSRPDLFPSVHRLLEADAFAPTKVLVLLDEVQRIASPEEHDTVLLTVDGGDAQLRSPGRTVSGTGFGASTTVTLSRPALRRIADAAVGRELTCDIHGSDRALVWRSPGQPDFVALMMPVA